MSRIMSRTPASGICHASDTLNKRSSSCPLKMLKHQIEPSKSTTEKCRSASEYRVRYHDWLRQVANMFRRHLKRQRQQDTLPIPVELFKVASEKNAFRWVTHLLERWARIIFSLAIS